MRNWNKNLTKTKNKNKKKKVFIYIYNLIGLERFLYMWKGISFKFVMELQNILKFAHNLVNLKLIN